MGSHGSTQTHTLIVANEIGTTLGPISRIGGVMGGEGCRATCTRVRPGSIPGWNHSQQPSSCGCSVTTSGDGGPPVGGQGVQKTCQQADCAPIFFKDMVLRLDKSSCQLILAINFKPTLLSQRLHRSAPDTVWLNPKSRFKFIPEFIPSRCNKSSPN